MNLESFEAALDAYGSDLGGWPKALRAEAVAFAKASPEALALLDADSVMRSMLAVRRPVKAPAGLADKIVARAMAISPPAGPQTSESAPQHHPSQSSFFRPVDLMVLGVFFVAGALLSQQSTRTELGSSFDSLYSVLPV